MNKSDAVAAMGPSLAAYARAAGQPFPQDPREQLVDAIEAVFASWQSGKAREYRRPREISEAIGTAVTVQTMVYGNAGRRSGAVVGFTRNPVSGGLDLCDAGIITPEVARQRTAKVLPSELCTTRATAGDGQPFTPSAHAASASSGVAVGCIAFDEAAAQAQHAAGNQVILVRRDAEAADLAALELALGLLTQRGARTSHGAVVARQLGKVCRVGCAEMHQDEQARTLTLGGITLHDGDDITLDGNDGAVYTGLVHTEVEPMVQLQAQLRALQNPQ